MLLDLHVRNLSVMAEASVELGPGLNVLTGETGAGKSLLVDSLSLLAGSRASADMIRTGAETLSVTGVFAPGSGAWVFSPLGPTRRSRKSSSTVRDPVALTASKMRLERRRLDPSYVALKV